MTIFAIIFLILLGLLLLLIEFALIPGVTVAGIGGFLMLIAAVYLAFAKFGVMVGIISILVIFTLAPLMFYVFFKTKAGKMMVLETNIDAKVDTFDENNIHAGDTGWTIGRLAPMGKIKVNGETVEAQSTGGFIDQNRQVKIVKVSSNKIIVELIKTEENG